MIFTDKTKKPKTFIIDFFKLLKLPPGLKVEMVWIKYHAKTTFLIVISTIILWTGLVSYLIFRNTPKPMITELANILRIQGNNKKRRVWKL